MIPNSYYSNPNENQSNIDSSYIPTKDISNYSCSCVFLYGKVFSLLVIHILFLIILSYHNISLSYLAMEGGFLATRIFLLCLTSNLELNVSLQWRFLKMLLSVKFHYLVVGLNFTFFLVHLSGLSCNFWGLVTTSYFLHFTCKRA